MRNFDSNFKAADSSSVQEGLKKDVRFNTWIRATTPHDAPLLKEMMHTCITDLVQHWYSPNPEKLREWLGLITEEGLVRGATDPRFNSFVICECGSDVPVGLGAFDIVEGRGLQNYVSPRCQGKGVGRAIAKNLDIIAAKAGFSRYPGLATRAGLEFWKAQGHIQTGPSQLFLDFFEMFPVLRILPDQKSSKL
ncbi:MAG: GNAT family N-acetyltransferase [Bdellovibrionota bacterium]